MESFFSMNTDDYTGLYLHFAMVSQVVQMISDTEMVDEKAMGLVPTLHRTCHLRKFLIP